MTERQAVKADPTNLAARIPVRKKISGCGGQTDVDIRLDQTALAIKAANLNRDRNWLLNATR
ncbi:MAG: hypothetical protein J0H18_18405 [Rhizobiales bacterium]|nr:hypothetical protein [Hyphomicrobiales bacterium]